MGVIYIGVVVHKKGSKFCFSLATYEFCCNNAFYSVNLSFTMFIVLLSYFDTEIVIISNQISAWRCLEKYCKCNIVN